MADWPNTLTVPGGIVTSTLGMYAEQFLLGNGSGSTAGTEAWSTANLAVFMPILVPKTITIKLLAVQNGTTMAGTNHADMGLYTREGARIVSIGSTIQTGTSTWQSFDITDTELTPDWYYLALAMDTNTDHVFKCNMGSNNMARSVGMQQMATAFPLPATATFATLATNRPPMMLATGVVTL